jgi:2-hydroxy-3-keto-5-methylthiopentenyl-1-phosphate phosphatase
MREPGQRPIVFMDFDGTISRADVVDAILERFASSEWMQIEREWQAGRIGSRECLSAQMSHVVATPAELGSLLDEMEIDSGFPALLSTCARHGLPVRIVSDGFDYCITRILATLPAREQHALEGASVHASHLEPGADGRWTTSFPFYRGPCTHGCATCKVAVMRALNPEGRPSIFVGDGRSDQHASREADVVFAKQQLATICDQHGVAYVGYADLADVAVHIEDGMRSGRSWHRSSALHITT